MSKFVMFLSSWTARRLRSEVVEADSLFELLQKSARVIVQEIYHGEAEAYDVSFKDFEDRIEMENRSYRPTKKYSILKSDIEESYEYNIIISKIAQWCSEGDAETRVHIMKY